MSPVERLFFEISGDSSKLNQELQKAIATAKAGADPVKILQDIQLLTF